MSKKVQAKFSPQFYDHQKVGDPVMHREKAHKDWYFVARRLKSDKRGFIAPGKSRARTSGRVNGE